MMRSVVHSQILNRVHLIIHQRFKKL